MDALDQSIVSHTMIDHSIDHPVSGSINKCDLEQHGFAAMSVSVDRSSKTMGRDVRRSDGMCEGQTGCAKVTKEKRREKESLSADSWNRVDRSRTMAMDEFQIHFYWLGVLSASNSWCFFAPCCYDLDSSRWPPVL